MKVGIHSSVFTGRLDHAGIEKSVVGAADAGYDVLEIPIMDPEGLDVDFLAAALESHNLQMTGSLGLTSETDISSEDPAVVAAGENRLFEALDCVADVGGSHLCGVIYSAMTKYQRPASEAGIANSKRVVDSLASEAHKRGISIALEVVNRYESNVINTAGEALAYLDDLGSDNVAVHLDTYHMNIEESNLWQPVLEAGPRLGYVHIGENHRGYLGSGHLPFGALFRALRSIEYDGVITFESFSSAVVDENLSNTLGVWRNLWSDPNDLAARANDFIRSSWAAVQ